MTCLKQFIEENNLFWNDQSKRSLNWKFINLLVIVRLKVFHRKIISSTKSFWSKNYFINKTWFKREKCFRGFIQLSCTLYFFNRSLFIYILYFKLYLDAYFKSENILISMKFWSMNSESIPSVFRCVNKF